MGESSNQEKNEIKRSMDGEFGLWLDTTMENNRIKGRDIAKALGVSDGAVSRWRSGAAKPGPAITAKLGKILGVDPIRLVLTAGHIDPEDAPGIDPLSVPTATVRREKAIQTFAAIKELTEEGRERLLEVYDEITGNDDHAQGST